MKKRSFITVTLVLMILAGAGWLSANQWFKKSRMDIVSAGGMAEIEGCVFRTAFEGEGVEEDEIYLAPTRVEGSVEDGLAWLADAQAPNGGYGAGLHSMQHVRDPHAVKTDPATTAMVAMALVRTGNTLKSGDYSKNLKKALNHLLTAVENSDPNSSNITSITGTQIQAKLGQNIDVVMTSQFLTNVLEHTRHDPNLHKRVKDAIQVCVNKIEGGLAGNGSMKGSGWAGVLQSSFAASALETAEVVGVEVEEEALDKARSYNKSQYDVESNSVTTRDAAGIVLYSVSGSSRSSAKEAREAKRRIEEAKKAGTLKDSDEVSEENLIKAGVPASQAMKLGTAYKVNESAKRVAQSDEVLKGYGNNGGEEFLSFLQTGEGLIMSGGNDWKKWYDNTSHRLVQIQNQDGSWNGHHCITSPVFCTATCLMILAVNNDIENLREFTYRD